MGEYIQPMVSCRLKLVKIVEPMPAEELEELDEVFFAYLKTHPQFLFFVLEKEPNRSSERMIST